MKGKRYKEIFESKRFKEALLLEIVQINEVSLSVFLICQPSVFCIKKIKIKKNHTLH